MRIRDSRLLYGPQIVDLGLGLCFERGRGQNPDTPIAEFNGSRTTTKRNDPEPTEWPAKRNEVSKALPKSSSISDPEPSQAGSAINGRESVTTHLEKVQTSLATSRMTVSLMGVICGLPVFVLRLLLFKRTRLYTKLWVRRRFCTQHAEKFRPVRRYA